MDLVIKYKNESGNTYPNILITKLLESFKNLSNIEEINPIFTASVPIIKLIVDPMQIAKEHNKAELSKFYNSNMFLEYKYNINELRKIKIDITFAETDQNSIENSVDFTKNTLESYPELVSSIRFLKRLLLSSNLNNSHKGKYKILIN